MTPEQKAAFVVARAAHLNAEIAAMQAENEHRLAHGNSVAYGEEEFRAVIDSYSDITHNSVIEFFRDV